jgi:hypothetical protein
MYDTLLYMNCNPLAQFFVSYKILKRILVVFHIKLNTSRIGKNCLLLVGFKNLTIIKYHRVLLVKLNPILILVIHLVGNISPYMISYLRNRTSEISLRNTDNLWISNAASLAGPFSLTIGGLLDRYLGVRIATAVGCTLYW